MIKNDGRERLELNISNLNSKKNIRSYLLKKWSQEKEQQKFIYFVETLMDKNRIYLERPAGLNKGCDFMIKVENLIIFKNGNDKPPTHNDLLGYIKNKKKLTKEKYNNLISYIEKIYACEDIKNEWYSDLETELILKLSKWFFVEQDITYWANSGRDMLFKAIKEI